MQKQSQAATLPLFKVLKHELANFFCKGEDVNILHFMSLLTYSWVFLVVLYNPLKVEHPFLDIDYTKTG